MNLVANYSKSYNTIYCGRNDYNSCSRLGYMQLCVCHLHTCKWGGALCGLWDYKNYICVWNHFRGLMVAKPPSANWSGFHCVCDIQLFCIVRIMAGMNLWFKSFIYLQSTELSNSLNSLLHWRLYLTLCFILPVSKLYGGFLRIPSQPNMTFASEMVFRFTLCGL